MEHAEQVAAVGLILDTEKEKREWELSLSRIQEETGPAKPAPPSHQTVERTYPEIKPKTKFFSIKFFIPYLILCVVSALFMILGIGDSIALTIEGLLLLVCLIYIPVYYFKIYKPGKAAEIESIKNSAEYTSQCAQLDAQYDAQQAAYDNEYALAKTDYETVKIPAYEQAFAEWKADREQRRGEAAAALDSARDRLNDLYETTKLIPAKFRDIPALEHIYETISSSDYYDVKDAIASYEKELQLRATYEQNRKLAEQNALQAESNRLQDEQNYLTDMQTHAINRQTAVNAAAALDARQQRKKTQQILRGRK